MYYILDVSVCVFLLSLESMCFLYFSLSIEATDLLQKLSLDSQTKTLEIPEPTKKVIFYVVYVWESEFLIRLMNYRNLLCPNLLLKNVYFSYVKICLTQ